MIKRDSTRSNRLLTLAIIMNLINGDYIKVTSKSRLLVTKNKRQGGTITCAGPFLISLPGTSHGIAWPYGRQRNLRRIDSGADCTWYTCHGLGHNLSWCWIEPWTSQRDGILLV